MMPLLKNISRENVIPIMDFEDPTQTNLNFLVLHVFDIMPSVSMQQSISMHIPCDQSEPVKYLKIDDVHNLTNSDLRSLIEQNSKPVAAL